jgi:DNA-binding transcriptional ArsR family regulator
MLERRIEQVARAVNELQSRMDLFQNEHDDSSEIEQLASENVLLDNSGKENTRKPHLPDSVKPAIRELLRQKNRWISAEQIAESTRRSRNVESGYLQRLFDKGYLMRQRIGRNVYYSIRKDALRYLEES